MFTFRPHKSHTFRPPVSSCSSPLSPGAPPFADVSQPSTTATADGPDKVECTAIMKRFVGGRVADPLQAVTNAHALRYCFDILRQMILDQRNQVWACHAYVWQRWEALGAYVMGGKPHTLQARVQGGLTTCHHSCFCSSHVLVRAMCSRIWCYTPAVFPPRSPSLASK